MKTQEINIKHYIIWILASTTVLGILALQGTALAQDGTWVKMADMPTARYWFSTAVVDGKIYAIGGTQDSGWNLERAGLSTIEVYDAVTDSWIRKTDMQTQRMGLSTSAVDGKIYAIGGRDRNITLTTVEAYDPATDTWTPKADMPAPEAFAATSVVDGMIYVIGGVNSSSLAALPAVQAYDPLTDTWRTKADMPTARYLSGSSAVNGKIYAMGGTPDGAHVVATVEAYDPATDTWVPKADMLTTRSGLSTSVVNEIIYAIGGSPSGASNDWLGSSVAEAYDVTTDTWTEVADMPTARARHISVALDGIIYVIGGGLKWPEDAFSTVEAFIPDSLSAVSPQGKLVTVWAGIKSD